MRRVFLLAGLAGLSVPAVAADNDVILVTGHSLPQAIGSEVYSTVTVDRDRLTTTASGRMEDVLRDVASFQQFRRTDSRAANPTSQGVTLRGLGGNAASRALVTLDGVPLADPFGGWLPWSAVDPASLGAVRVTRGGGAGAFGAGAMTGTIELISADSSQSPTAQAGLMYGSRDAIAADAALSGELGQGHGWLSGGFARGDGYMLIGPDQRGPADVPARYEQWHVTARGAVPIGDQTELQLRGMAFGDTRLRGLDGTESTSDGVDASVRLIGRGDWAWEGLAYIQAREFTSGFVSVNNTRSTTTQTLDQFNTPATGWGGKLEVRPPLGEAIELRLGADMRGAKGKTRERFRYVGGVPTRLRTAGGEQSVMGGFAELGVKASEALTLTGGARIDRWSIDNGYLDEMDPATGAMQLALRPAKRDDWRTSLRGGLSLAVTPAIRLRAAGYTGWRLPTLNELYRPFRVGTDAVAANPDLKPERLQGVEAGVDITPMNNVSFGATVYWNRLEDAIGNVTLGTGPGLFPDVGFVAGSYRKRLNLDSIRARGVEADARVNLGGVGLSASYAYIDARVRADGVSAALDGKRPAQVPKHRASTTVSYSHGERATGSVTLRYEAKQFEDDLNIRALDDSFTVDAYARMKLTPSVSVELRAENLFDKTIEAGISGTGIIDRGSPRTLWAGLRWTLD